MGVLGEILTCCVTESHLPHLDCAGCRCTGAVSVKAIHGTVVVGPELEVTATPGVAGACFAREQRDSREQNVNSSSIQSNPRSTSLSIRKVGCVPLLCNSVCAVVQGGFRMERFNPLHRDFLRTGGMGVAAVAMPGLRLPPRLRRDPGFSRRWGSLMCASMAPKETARHWIQIPSTAPLKQRQPRVAESYYFHLEPISVFLST